MDNVNAISEVDKLVKSASDAVYRFAKNEMAGRLWTSATYDSRITDNDFCALSVMYFHLSDGTKSYVGVPTEAAGYMAEIRDIRHDHFEENQKFYGIMITVYPSGDHKIDYNYDPNWFQSIPFPP